MRDKFVRWWLDKAQEPLEVSLTSRLYLLFVGGASILPSGLLGLFAGLIFGKVVGTVLSIILTPIFFAALFAIAIEVQKRRTAAQIAISKNAADMATEHIKLVSPLFLYSLLRFRFALTSDREVRLVDFQTTEHSIHGDLQYFFLGDSYPSDLKALDTKSLRDRYKVHAQPRIVFRPGEPLVVPVIILPSVDDGLGMKYEISVEVRGRFADLRRGNAQELKLHSMGPAQRITIQFVLSGKEQRCPLVNLKIPRNENLVECGYAKDLSSGTVTYEWEIKTNGDPPEALPPGKRTLLVVLAEESEE